jgi:hypothetical protein
MIFETEKKYLKNVTNEEEKKFDIDFKNFFELK